MHTTHKQLCDKAKTILAAHVEDHSGATDGHTLAELVGLFDGPEQREAYKFSPMTLHDLQTLCCRTLPPRGQNHWFEMPAPSAAPWQIDDAIRKKQELFFMRIDLLHAILGVCGESGEQVDPVKKSMFYGKELDVENLREEAGDLLWYIAGPLCRALGCTLEDLARANVAKLQKRYPEKYTDQAAIDRADKQ